MNILLVISAISILFGFAFSDVMNAYADHEGTYFGQYSDAYIAIFNEKVNPPTPSEMYRDLKVMQVYREALGFKDYRDVDRTGYLDKGYLDGNEKARDGTLGSDFNGSLLDTIFRKPSVSLGEAMDLLKKSVDRHTVLSENNRFQIMTYVDVLENNLKVLQHQLANTQHRIDATKETIQHIKEITDTTIKTREAVESLIELESDSNGPNSELIKPLKNLNKSLEMLQKINYDFEFDLWQDLTEEQIKELLLELEQEGLINEVEEPEFGLGNAAPVPLAFSLDVDDLIYHHGREKQQCDLWNTAHSPNKIKLWIVGDYCMNIRQEGGYILFIDANDNNKIDNIYELLSAYNDGKYFTVFELLDMPLFDSNDNGEFDSDDYYFRYAKAFKPSTVAIDDNGMPYTVIPESVHTMEELNIKSFHLTNCYTVPDDYMEIGSYIDGVYPHADWKHYEALAHGWEPVKLSYHHMRVIETCFNGVETYDGLIMPTFDFVFGEAR